ncbi:hypothetical protein [Haloparvum sp. PAK95]|uniref:hypothetical protein n=1 Tax=Haloparvum sp. PAK95 TaxID=3418962 RepID=UPI003D2F0704
MTCINCGGEADSGVHRLHFERQRGESKRLELELCEACLEEMLAEQWVSRVE